MLGRIYLGMHSLIDIIGGLVIGLVILAFWLTVHEHVDDFVASGQNGKHTFVGIFFYKDSIFLLILDSLQILDSWKAKGPRIWKTSFR